MSEMDEVLQEFLAESRENLDQLDRDLVALEKDPTDAEGLARVFRTFHTIKGTCGFFGLTRLAALTHAGENLLSRLRDGRLTLNPDITTALLALLDAVRAILARVAETGQEGDEDYAALVARLTALQEPGTAPAPEPMADEGAAEARAAGAPEGSIRVDVGLLDRLMNLVGELVLARNQVLQLTAGQRDPALLSTSQRLNLITTELQEGVMKTRMQPISTVWNKLPRLVRDLARECGKEVRLTLAGEETELDRSILEAIKDPLTHLVRNAVDHGIEAPDVRRGRGKQPGGHLCLQAYHEGGQVNIEIADDGAGIDPERIRKKALERGLISREQAGRLGDHDLVQLIFLPGFSTAEQVTSVSGRGVGMDVVKTNIEKVGGAIEVRSRPGLGTTVKIKIPLTLAIIPALVVTSGGARYAIPQGSLLELVRLEGEAARRGIENVHGAPVYRLRGRLLPLVHLDRELGAPAGPDDGRAVNLVVLQADDRRFGLVVDRVNDTEEIVVKPLGKLLQNIPLFAGATIMGDGKVALILDVLGLAQRARVVPEVRERTLPAPAPAGANAAEARHQVLLFALDDERRLAVPLDRVARLEEVPASAVEQTVDQETFQFGGRILPLVRLARAFPGRGTAPAADRDPLHVVVCADGAGQVGVVVDRILDVVETPLAVQTAGRRPGILGSAVIRQRVTDLLDVPALLRAALPEGGRPSTPEARA
ncbi:MAG TPA: chemotaxis protein CheA [Gemmataceae bacterium]|nr:chemotaxis protein CheA [Gemmataceae bacterium]